MPSGLAKIVAIAAVATAGAALYQAYHRTGAPTVTVAEHERLGQRASQLMASLAKATSERDILSTALATSVSRSSHDALVVRYESLKVAFERSREAEARMARKIADLEHARGAGIARAAVLEGELKAAQERFDAVHRLYTGRFGSFVAASQRTREGAQ